VLKYLYQRMKRLQFYATLTVLLPLLMFEYWSVPPGYALAVDRPPEVYRWLAQEPGDAIVVEYPMIRADHIGFYTYLFWQRVHQRKLVNGALPNNAQAWVFFKKVEDLANPQTPELLKAAGVKYVVVHNNVYEEGLIPGPLKRYFPEPASGAVYNGGRVPRIPHSLKLLKTFGSDMVFSLEEDAPGNASETAGRLVDGAS
jgi:hypothetical protein